MANKRICIKLIDVTHEEFKPYVQKLENEFGMGTVCSKETYWGEHNISAEKELESIKEYFAKQDKTLVFTVVKLQSWVSTK